MTTVQATGELTAMLPYYGGKRDMAGKIIRQLGPHRAYAELCMGSAAVLFSKPESTMELVNDLYGHVVNLARVLASDRWWDLAERCYRTLMHEEIFLEAKERSPEDLEEDFVPATAVGAVTDLHVEFAYWFVVMSWMGRNGSAGTAQSNLTIARRFTANGGSGGLRWSRVATSMEAWHDRLRRASITRMNAIELAERLDDDADWALYIDPPYLKKGRRYIKEFNAQDHARMAEVLGAKRRARVVVSYYEHPKLESLYPRSRWTLVQCPTVKNLANANGRTKGEAVVAPEVLLVNGPDLEDGLFVGGD